MSKPKAQVSLKSAAPIQEEPVQQAPGNAFSDDEIRVRAYQIYESRERNSNNPDADWSQAQTELTELLGGK